MLIRKYYEKITSNGVLNFWVYVKVYPLQKRNLSSFYVCTNEHKYVTAAYLVGYADRQGTETRN